VNNLQTTSLRAATQLIDRARISNRPDLLAAAVSLIEEVINFDELVTQARALETPTNA
jgi:hypothetical protein